MYWKSFCNDGNAAYADSSLGNQLKTLGIPQFHRYRILLVEARLSLITVGLAAFGRAIAEIGAVMIVGGNIGKNKDTDEEGATFDYMTCFEGVYENVDYITLNVSSPNTNLSICVNPVPPEVPPAPVIVIGVSNSRKLYF